MSADVILAESRLRELVETESPTGHRAGIAACFRLIDAWASPLFGRSGELRKIDGVSHLYWPAVREGGVLILGHLDTVWPLGTLDAMPFRVSDGRASGPGTFDMKAGTVAAIGALERLESLDDVALLLTADEETGSTTSRALIEEAALRSRAVLIFEPSLDGALKVARRGASIYRLRAHGRAAHAGLEPELGANALIEMSRQVLEIIKAPDPELGTNVTPTVLHSGTTVNTVPDLAEAGVDVRAWSLEELHRVDDFMRALAPVDPSVTLSLTGGINRPPMQREYAQPLFELAAAVADELGLPPLEAAAVGGGSDGNFTAGLGVATLDGLGPLGDGAHAPHEWVRLESIVERSKLAAGLIERLRTVGEATYTRHGAVADWSTQ
ncbi:M20 family metallopeptidase [Leucobacter celer]|jgi:glutamate carboxypeptidase|uniref:M20 family metallopeptidase n=1 Tax=Leucobacter celer TaxID=668625 RepID=UPI0006A7B381|nr:M20 family metallopeptidase [Leucobacter celer]